MAAFKPLFNGKLSPMLQSLKLSLQSLWRYGCYCLLLGCLSLSLLILSGEAVEAIAVTGAGLHQRQQIKGNLGNEILYYILVDSFFNGEPANDIPIYAFPLDNKNLPEREITYNQANQLLLPMMFAPNSLDNFGLYAGGDLKGVLEKLDYLKDLGVTKIILSPIQDNANGISYIRDFSTHLNLGKKFTLPYHPFYSHAQAAHHGYWIKDWFEIDEHFRQPEDQQSDRYQILRQVLDEAGKRGIGVILDLTLHQTSPVNSSAQAPSFDLNLPLANWFFDNGGVYKHGKLLAPYWNPTTQTLDPMGWFDPPMAIDWNRPTPQMLQQGQLATDLPTLNHQSPQVQSYLLDAVKFWLTFNSEGTRIAGFRVDAVKHINPKFWLIFEELVYNINPEAILIGEYFSGGYQNQESIQWLQGTQHFTMFDFDLSGAMRNFFARDRSWNGRAFLIRQLCLGRQGIYYTNPWYRWLQTLLNPAGTLAIPKSALDQISDEQARGWVTYAETHDLPRLRTAYPGMSDAAYLSLIKFLFIARGVPMLTYGTETGLGIPYHPRNTGLFGVGGDPFNRPMMIWPETLGWNPQIYDAVRTMAHLRQQYPLLRYGTTKFLYPRHSHRDQDIFMLRQPQDCQIGDRIDCVAVLYAYSTQGGAFDIPLKATGIRQYKVVETGVTGRVLDEMKVLRLNAEEARVIILQ